MKFPNDAHDTNDTYDEVFEEWFVEIQAVLAERDNLRFRLK